MGRRINIQLLSLADVVCFDRRHSSPVELPVVLLVRSAYIARPVTLASIQPFLFGSLASGTHCGVTKTKQRRYSWRWVPRSPERSRLEIGGRDGHPLTAPDTARSPPPKALCSRVGGDGKARKTTAVRVGRPREGPGDPWRNQGLWRR